MYSPLFSSALQNRLTAGLCHSNHTYGDLLFIHVFSEPTEMHCSTGLGRMHSPLSGAALQDRLTPGLCHCKCTSGDLLLIQVCSEPTEMHCSTGQGKCIPHCSVVICKTGSQQACDSAITPLEICSSHRLTPGLCHSKYTFGDLLFIQVGNDSTPMHCSTGLGKCIPHCSVVLCKTGSQQACDSDCARQQV